MQAGKEYDCPISLDFPQEQQQPEALVAVKHFSGAVSVGATNIPDLLPEIT